MLKLKLQYLGHLMWKADSLEKTWCWERLNSGGEFWRTEDKIVGWHHWLNGCEFEQATGVGERLGSLACCSLWGRRVGHDWATKQQHIFKDSLKMQDNSAFKIIIWKVFWHVFRFHIKTKLYKLTDIEFEYLVKIIIVSDKVLKILLPFSAVYLCEAGLSLCTTNWIR